MASNTAIRLAYTDLGNGPPVILIHGFPLNRNMWTPQLDALEKAGFRIVTPDLRGFGETQSVESAYTMDHLADDLIALMDSLGIPQAAIGGMSMGGYVLLNLLTRYPDRVCAALFIVTQAQGDDDAGRARRTTLANLALNGHTTEITDVFDGLLFSEQTPKTKPELVRQVRGWMETTSARGLYGGLLAIRDRDDYRSVLSRLTLPCLVIGAEEDRAIPIERSRALAEGLPNATFCRIPYAGHMANMEQPERFNDCLISFLNQHISPTNR